MPFSHGKSSAGQRSSNAVPVSERQQMALVLQMTSDTQSGDSDSGVGSRSSLEHRNERGETPLHVAAIKGDLNQVTALLDQGADPNIPDFAGWRPLHEASNHGWKEVAETLLARGASPDVKGFNDDTSLHDAAVNNHIQLVKLLLENGANPRLKNKKGKTPAEVAASPEIKRLLTDLAKREEGEREVEEKGAEGDSPSEEQSKAEMRRLPPHGKEKCNSPRVTLRIHQLKEKKEKAKGVVAAAAAAAAVETESFETSNEAAIKGGGDEVTGGGVEEGGEEGSTGGGTPVKEGGEERVEGEQEVQQVQQASVKRAAPDEEDESRRKRRKEGEGEVTGVESPGPKVPPLKIVIPPGSGETEQARKSGAGRHSLPYVVAAATATTEEPPPPPPPVTTTPPEQIELQPSAELQPQTQEEKDSHKRVLRSHRCGNGSSGQSGNSSPAASPRQVSPLPETGGSGTGVGGGETASGGEEPKETSGGETTSSSTTPAVELHPRKRKLKPREQPTTETNGNESAPTPPAATQPQPHHLEPQPPTANCYQLFLNIRKQIDRRRKGLFPVQPKPPQGFKDYLMNRCTYVLAGNNHNARIPPPTTTPPASVLPEMKDMYIQQDKERYRLRTQHVIEKEKLVLSVEQEILRVHGRAARAVANQALPFSACTILKDEEVYSPFTAEQEEKDRNARSRYNGRLFLSWLQDVDDKWEKIKEAMLLRHHNEAESLHAVQKMDWEWKLKEMTAPDTKPSVFDETHVPMVHVSDDFNLLPA